MFKPLGILFIMKLYARVSIFTKIVSIWKSYFWKKHAARNLDIDTQLLKISVILIFYQNKNLMRKWGRDFRTIKQNLFRWKSRKVSDDGI